MATDCRSSSSTEAAHSNGHSQRRAGSYVSGGTQSSILAQSSAGVGALASSRNPDNITRQGLQMAGIGNRVINVQRHCWPHSSEHTHRKCKVLSTSSRLAFCSASVLGLAAQRPARRKFAYVDARTPPVVA